MKRSRAFSIPSSLTKLKSVKFQEPEMNEEVEFNTPTSFERGPSKKKNRNEMDPSDEATDSPKRKHRKEISNKKNASSSPVSEKASSFRIIEEKENLFAAPNAKLFLVTDEKVQPMTFDEVIQYVSTIRKKDLSVPSSPEGATDSEEQIQKKKTLELIEDIMKEMELFQRVILHRTPGSLSQLLTMKEVEKVNALVTVIFKIAFPPFILIYFVVFRGFYTKIKCYLIKRRYSCSFYPSNRKKTSANQSRTDSFSKRYSNP